MAAKRVSSSQLAKLLRHAAYPICVFDEHRCVVLANTALQTLVDCPVEDMLGCTAHFHGESSGERAADIVNALCPPPQAFAGEPVSMALSLPGNSGKPAETATLSNGKSIRATYQPLAQAAESEQPCGVIAYFAKSPAPENRPNGASPDGSSIAPEWAELHAALQRARQFNAQSCQAFPLPGVSEATIRAVRMVAMLAVSPAACSIVAPVGAPREAMAQYLHGATPARKRGRFFAVDCGLLSWENLQEGIFSFLAAGEKGAEKRIDTILFNSLDALPAAFHSAAAEFFTRLSGEVRLLAAAKSPFQELSANGEIDKRLASLLSLAEIRIPPLAQRREDIPLTAQAAVEGLNALAASQKSGFSATAMDDLCLAPWPGDMAQLQSVVAEAFERSSDAEIGQADLPDSFRRELSAVSDPVRPSVKPIDLESHLAEIETALIRQALDQAKGNKTKAAELLGMTRPRFYRRLEQLGWSDAESDS